MCGDNAFLWKICRLSVRNWFWRTPLNTWRNNNVVITSKRRHFDVITSFWRRYYVKTTSFWRNYVKMTSFWRNNDVIIAWCVHWDFFRTCHHTPGPNMGCSWGLQGLFGTKVIYSRIKYGIELYGSSSASNMNKIQVIQNKLLKLVFKLDRLIPTNELHKNIKILNIDDIHKCNTLGKVNEMVSDRCSAVFRNYFEIKENSYDSRTCDQLTITLTRLCLGQHMVRLKGPHCGIRLTKVC